MKNLIFSVIAVIFFAAVMMWQHSHNYNSDLEELEKAISNINSLYERDRSVQTLISHNYKFGEHRQLVIDKLIPALSVPDEGDGFVRDFMDKEAKLLVQLDAHKQIIEELLEGRQETTHTLALLYCLTHFNLPDLLSKEEQKELYLYLHDLTWRESTHQFDHYLQIAACSNMATLNDYTEDEVQQLCTSHPNQTLRSHAVSFPKKRF